MIYMDNEENKIETENEIQQEDEVQKDDEVQEEKSQQVEEAQKEDEVQKEEKREDKSNNSQEETNDLSTDEQKIEEQPQEDKEYETVEQKPNTNNNNSQKMYIGYGKRLMVLIVVIVITLLISFMMLLKVVKYLAEHKERYSETTNSTYSVCLFDNDYYETECLPENMEYVSSLVNYITYTYTYQTLYDNIIIKNYNYYVESDLKIYNQDDASKILYEKKDKIVPEKKLTEENNVFVISDSVQIPFPIYNQLVANYKNKYGVSTKSSLTINLIVNDKKVSTLNIPLGDMTFNITKKNESNSGIIDKIIKEQVTIELLVYMLIFIISTIITIIFIIKTVMFLIKYSPKESEYRRYIKHLLINYDRIIVEVDDISKILENKKILEVNSFLELVDVRDTIDKPIMHMKVNDVKDAFYVNDEDKVYEFIIKESKMDKKI